MAQTNSPAHPIDSSPPLHINVVTETFPPEVNGVTLTLRHLTDGLRRRGHTVSVVRPGQANDEIGCFNPSETIVPGLPVPGYSELQFGLPVARVLRRLWTDEGPDIVYIATEGPLGWSAMRAAAQLGIPTLSGFHTNFHSYSRFYRLGWLQPVVLRYLRYLHNHTGGTVVPSFGLKQCLDNLGFRNVSVLGRGVDCIQFGPRYRSEELRRSWGLDDRGIAVTYVGRLAAEKNLYLALEAYHAMRRVHENVRFVLVGDGPLRKSLQSADPELVFCGMKTGQDLARHYASGDVFLFPSETETFGNVTLEAMASGLAVVAYDYAAAQAHVTHGLSGLLAPLGHENAFIDCAVRLVEEPTLIQQLRIGARTHATTISWSQVVDTFERCLTQVLRQAKGRAAAVERRNNLTLGDAGRLQR